MDRIDIIRFYDKEERMLGICAIPPNKLDPFYIGIEQRIGSPFVSRTSFGTMDLRNMK